MRDYNADIYQTNCRICDSQTEIWGVVDFNKSCEELNGNYLEYCGVPIYYLKCKNCNHIFSTDFDDWDLDDFKENIYNDDYILVDPEYEGARSKRDVEWFTKAINYNKELSILDYGAGNGVFGQELTNLGYNVVSYDPLWPENTVDLNGQKFDLVTAFEVLEHSPQPYETVLDIQKYLKPQGKVLITTLANDIMQGKRDPTYWYLAPRNGHVSMFSYQSIEILFSKIDMNVKHLAWNTHLAEPK